MSIEPVNVKSNTLSLDHCTH